MKYVLLVFAVVVAFLLSPTGDRLIRRLIIWNLLRKLRRDPYVRALRKFVKRANKETRRRLKRMSEEERREKLLQELRANVSPLERSIEEELRRNLERWNGEELTPEEAKRMFGVPMESEVEEK